MGGWGIKGGYKRGARTRGAGTQAKGEGGPHATQVGRRDRGLDAAPGAREGGGAERILGEEGERGPPR